MLITLISHVEGCGNPNEGLLSSPSLFFLTSLSSGKRESIVYQSRFWPAVLEFKNFFSFIGCHEFNHSLMKFATRRNSQNHTSFRRTASSISIFLNNNIFTHIYLTESIFHMFHRFPLFLNKKWKTLKPQPNPFFVPKGFKSKKNGIQ